MARRMRRYRDDEEPENVEALDELIAQEQAALEKVNADAEAVVSGTGTALVPMQQSAEAARADLARQRGQMTKLRNEITKRTEKMAALQQRKAEALERRAQRELERMERMMEPLQERLKLMQEGLWMVNLYLGRDEEIVRLCEGKPAPADTPVVVRQLVLAMDQECAVASEHGGIDSLSHELFDEWLQEDWAHVEQVLPEQKGVVALVPRYNSDPKHYEDRKTMADAMEGNEQTYFLIRNGGNVWRTWTEFKAGMHLIPRTQEFTGYFKNNWREFDADGNALTPEYVEPGTEEWHKAEQAAQAHERHFMRVALILEGLLHRTTIFNPLPDEGVGISFTDPRSHEAGRVKFVLDAERLLSSGELAPFDKWLGELTGQLRKGMRIVGNFRGHAFERANNEDEYGEYGRTRARRIHPKGAEKPTTGAIYRIEDAKPNGDLIIRYKRTEKTYIGDSWGYGGEYRLPKTRASCVIRPGDDFVIPVDLVDVPTIDRYLASRIERHSYTTMFPILKAVRRALVAEEAVEEPYREMMVGVLMREADVDEETARAALPELVRWYKTGNRIHRPLFLDSKDNNTTTEMLAAAGVDWDDVELAMTDPATGEGAHKSVKLIADEYKRRLKDADATVHEETVGGLKELHRDALLIARTRQGRYIVLTPEDKRPVYVRERQYTAGGALREDKRWVLPGLRLSRWTVLYTSERWAEWNLKATRKDHLTGPEQEEFVELARAKWEAKRKANQFDVDRRCILGGACAVAVEMRKDGSPREVQVYALGRDREYSDPFHKDPTYTGEPGILTSGHKAAPPKSVFYTWDFRWRRKGERIEVYQTDSSTSGWSGGRDWSSRDEAANVGPWHPDAWTYSKNNVVVWDDGGKALAKFHEMREALKAHEARKAQYQERVDFAEKSLERQWLQPRYEEIYQRFLEDYHDPELWHSNPAKKDLPLFPYGWRGRQRSMRDDKPAHLRALQALIEKDVEPWGMTVAETVELAVNDERFNFPFTYYEVHREVRVGDSDNGFQRIDYKKLPRDKWAVKPLPEDLAGMTYVQGFELVEPWPPEEEAEPKCDRCHEPKSECICAEIFCDGCGELEEDCICDDEDELGPDDVEGTVEEGIAALPAGDE